MILPQRSCAHAVPMSMLEESCTLAHTWPQALQEQVEARVSMSSSRQYKEEKLE